MVVLIVVAAVLVYSVIVLVVSIKFPMSRRTSDIVDGAGIGFGVAVLMNALLTNGSTPVTSDRALSFITPLLLIFICWRGIATRSKSIAASVQSEEHNVL